MENRPKNSHGNRSQDKEYNCFREDVCRSIQSIQIQHLDEKPYYQIRETRVIIDGKLYFRRIAFKDDPQGVMEKPAKNDGFDSVEDFFKWFHSDFQGKIVHWTDFRY